MQRPEVADIPVTLSNNAVKVTINPGGEGRSCCYEIIRLILDGVVEPALTTDEESAGV